MSSDSPLPAGRLRLIVALFGVVFVAVSMRLVQLQWVRGAELASRAERQKLSQEILPARPGEIVDRHGRLLAITVLAPSIYAVPRKIEDPATFASRVAKVLKVDPQRLCVSLESHPEHWFLWVARRIEPAQVDQLRSLDLPAGSWGVREEYRRQYPQGLLACHLLGSRGIDNHGRGGVEQQFDSLLRGEDGLRITMKDARGRTLSVREELTRPPQPGRTLVLTIDAVLQNGVERELDALMAEHNPTGGCAIVLDVATSDVLAMASRPVPDANQTASADAWMNRAIAAAYEPGSTFKPCVVAWAVSRGLLQTDEVIDCEAGAYRLGSRVLRDHHPLGPLSVVDVLVHSSNIGMAKIGERLGIEDLYRCCMAFGFGKPTGIALPGERTGTLRPMSLWNEHSLLSVPMGHELTVTPLQLIVAAAALARDGRLVSPRLVRGDVDAVFASAAPITDGPPVTSPVVSPEAARWVVGEAMAAVVERGTGQAAQLDGVTVFGKTGTAQKYDAQTGSFSHEKYVVSFLAGAPAENPAVLVLVMVDEPHGAQRSGGGVVAPAAKAMLEQALRRVGSLR